MVHVKPTKAGEMLKCCVLTSNLGTAGEDETGGVLKRWGEDVRRVVQDNDIDVLMLHLQEIGGKAYNEKFYEALGRETEASLLKESGWSTGLMSHNCNDADFTAVGAMVFVKEHAMHRVEIYDFIDKEYSNGLPKTLVQSRQFLSKKFVDAGASRKGWVRYRLRIDGHAWDLIAIHLYHDHDNWVTYNSDNGKGPSAERRSNALRESILEVEHAQCSSGLILAGDMNFRVDGKCLVESVKKRRKTAEVKIDKKEFSWGPDQPVVESMYIDNWKDLIASSCREAVHNIDRIERELQVRLSEQPVSWPPSYPLTPPCDPTSPIKLAYSVKRLPAWADRILYTSTPSLKNIAYRSLTSALDHSLVFLTWDSDLPPSHPQIGEAEGVSS